MCWALTTSSSNSPSNRQIVDWLPKDPGRLHRHMGTPLLGTPLLGEPIDHAQNVSRHGAECAYLLALPCLALPCLALPCLALPCLAVRLGLSGKPPRSSCEHPTSNP